VVRFDLDRNDNDNRLFGVTAQISWVPKPSYQVDGADAALRGEELAAAGRHRLIFLEATMSDPQRREFFAAAAGICFAGNAERAATPPPAIRVL